MTADIAKLKALATSDDISFDDAVILVDGISILIARIEELEKERDKLQLEVVEWKTHDEVSRGIAEKCRADAEAAEKRVAELERTIAARDRRIERLVWAMNYAREKGVRFPADDEPPIVHGDQS